MGRNSLLFTNLWNSVASGAASGDPGYIRDNLLKILNKSRENSLFNDQKLNPEDDTQIAEFIRNLDTMAEQLAYIEEQITTIALKYKD